MAISSHAESRRGRARTSSTPFATTIRLPGRARHRRQRGGARRTTAGCRTRLPSIVVSTVGTGIGGGTVIDGRTLKGCAIPRWGTSAFERHERDARIRAASCAVSRRLPRGTRERRARFAARYGATLDRLPAEHEAMRDRRLLSGSTRRNHSADAIPRARRVRRRCLSSATPLLARFARPPHTLLNGYCSLGRDPMALAQVIVAPGLRASGIRRSPDVGRDGARGCRAMNAHQRTSQSTQLMEQCHENGIDVAF